MGKVSTGEQSVGPAINSMTANTIKFAWSIYFDSTQLAQPAHISNLVDHLFRHEAGKLVSVLTGVFGTQNLELAEDVVQDSLLEAIDQWPYKGVPDNPSAWLFRVAKNKALNILNREGYRRKYESAVKHSAPEMTAESTQLPSDEEIRDDQLRMIFTCCHPAISPDSQIALALKTLCGFSISEIARAFLTTEENIHKRLVRARQSIREAKVSFEIPGGKSIEKRLRTVLETIYLLFNEGYSASSGDEIIRFELCEEAIRLAQIIIADTNIQHKENVHALLSLMFLNASRFRARQDAAGNLLTLEEQDRSLWNARMRDTGLMHLAEATKNDTISSYHIMAAIAAQYSIAPDYASTKWENILSLYDTLIQFDNSPIILLNRSIVLSKLKGAKEALTELERIKDHQNITSYYLFYSTKAEFYSQLEEPAHAIDSLKTAIELAPLETEKKLLERKMSLVMNKAGDEQT